MEIAPPLPRSARQHQKEKCPCFLDLAGVKFFLKWKGHFSFWCSALQVFGQCGGASIRTRFCENNFLGKGFRKTSANSFSKFGGNSDFARAQEGSGEECARVPFSIFGFYSSNSLAILLANSKNSGACFIACALGLGKGTLWIFLIFIGRFDKTQTLSARKIASSTS